MSVEVVFISDGVEVPDASGRVAQQRVRKLIECSDLCLIAKPSDLKKEGPQVQILALALRQCDLRGYGIMEYGLIRFNQM